jgi:hypothetical protein
VVLTERNVSRTVAFKTFLSSEGDFSFGKSQNSQRVKSMPEGADRKACARAVEWAAT